MNTIKLATFITLTSLSLIACKENPHDDDSTSTIRVGNNLEVDSATAHANNSYDSIKTKPGNHSDSVTHPDNNNMGANNVNSGTKGNDNVKPAGQNSNINTNRDRRNPK